MTPEFGGTQQTALSSSSNLSAISESDRDAGPTNRHSRRRTASRARATHAADEGDQRDDNTSEGIVRRAVRGLPAFMTIAETAELFGKSERTVRSYIARGLLRAVRVCGGSPRIPLSEIERILLEGLT
jgi:excisionase family DNA binding protein